MSLRWKTILGVALIESVLLLLLVSLAMGQMRSSNNEGLVKRAETVTALFAATSKDLTLAYDLASLDSLAQEVIKNPGVRYARVRGQDGSILSYAGDKANSSTKFTADSSLASVDDGIYDAAAVMREGGSIFGWVEVGIDTTEIVSTLNALERWSYSIAALELALVALFSFLLGTYLTSQLAELRRAARSVSENKLDVEVPVKSQDEVGEVATAFNRMILGLKESRKKRDEYESRLESLNESLEQRVDRRTKQLQDSLDRLLKTQIDLEKESAERQKAEVGLRQAQKIEAVGHLAAGVAHEINTPIQFIGDSMFFVRDAVRDFTSYSTQLKQIILESHDDDAKERLIKRLNRIEEELDIDYLTDSTPEAIDRALNGIDRVAEIVSAMNAFGENRSTHREPACINKVLEQTLVVSSHAHRNCARVTSDLDTHLPLTNCHLSDITQAFLNIVLNAAHAVADRFGESDQGAIQVKSHRELDSIVVTISDNGGGMTEEVRNKIFDPFFTTKEVGSGTGQGLSVAYDTIVNVHNGSIDVQSTPNEGTTVTVQIPIVVVEPDSPMQTDPKSALL